MAEPINTANDAMKLMELRAYLAVAIRSFERDGPDTPFQHGYLAALKEVLKQMEKDRG